MAKRKRPKAGEQCYYLMHRAPGHWTVEMGEVERVGTPSTRTGSYRVKAVTGFPRGSVFRLMEDVVFRHRADAEQEAEYRNDAKVVA